MSRPESEDDACPTFAELRAKLVEHGCMEVRRAVLGTSGPDAPTERYILNPDTGKEIPVEHWEDAELVRPSFCSHVCRRLGIDETAFALHTSRGPVHVKSPAPPAVN